MSSPEMTWVGKEKQTSKVFVGGIPQDMDQFGLQREFSKYATVRKAWLPRPREGQNQSVSGTHRGFGFVIFQDDDAVDLLLGNDNNSKFFVLSDGSKVEVKRAVWNATLSPKMDRNTEAGDAVKGVSCPKTQPSSMKNQGSEWRGYSQQGPTGAHRVSNRIKNMPTRAMAHSSPGGASFFPVDDKHAPPSSWVEQSGSNHCQAPWLIQASPQGSMLWTAMPKEALNANGTSTSLPAEHWSAQKMGCGGCTTMGDLPQFPINGNQLATWSPEALFQQAKDLHGEGLVAVLCQNMPDYYED